MTDEVEEQAVDETPKAPVKTYTQAEVDRLVNIQKSRYAPLKEELDKIKGTENETLKAYEGVITKLVGDMSKEVPPSILKLLAKQTPLEQLEYLSDPANNVVFEKKAFPLPKKKAMGLPEFKPHKLENPF
jgi:hypothetical protein